MTGTLRTMGHRGDTPVAWEYPATTDEALAAIAEAEKIFEANKALGFQSVAKIGGEDTIVEKFDPAHLDQFQFAPFAGGA